MFPRHQSGDSLSLTESIEYSLSLTVKKKGQSTEDSLSMTVEEGTIY